MEDFYHVSPLIGLDACQGPQSSQDASKPGLFERSHPSSSEVVAAGVIFGEVTIALVWQESNQDSRRDPN